jgi:hypothetical protein
VTTHELAARVGVTPEVMRELLEESRDAGVVEPSPAGWRLSPAAERDFGAALRALGLPGDDYSTPARRAHSRDLRPAA